MARPCWPSIASPARASEHPSPSLAAALAASRRSARGTAPSACAARPEGRQRVWADLQAETRRACPRTGPAVAKIFADGCGGNLRTAALVSFEMFSSLMFPARARPPAAHRCDLRWRQRQRLRPIRSQARSAVTWCNLLQRGECTVLQRVGLRCSVLYRVPPCSHRIRKHLANTVHHAN